MTAPCIYAGFAVDHGERLSLPCSLMAPDRAALLVQRWTGVDETVA